MTEMVVQNKTVLTPNLGAFVREIAELVADGWEVDDDHEPGLFGFSYECHLVRQVPEGHVEKLTRAEILANARAAKKAKKAQQEQEDEED